MLASSRGFVLGPRQCPPGPSPRQAPSRCFGTEIPSSSAWRQNNRPCLRSSARKGSVGGTQPERSSLVAEEVIFLMFQLDLDIQLQRCLNIEEYEQAQDVRRKRLKVDEAIQGMKDRKAAREAGSAAEVGGDASAGLSVADFASEGLRLRSEMQRAVEQERYKDAASFRDMLAELDRESKRVQALAEEKGRRDAPKLRLGQRVLHRSGGYRGVVVGWDMQCCESDEWTAEAGVGSLDPQPFYHLLVDVRDWATEVGLPPTAYVAQEYLTAPELESEGLAWIQVHGSEPLLHPYLPSLFLGMDGRGDYIPCRHLRDKFNVQRRDVYKAGEEPGQEPGKEGGAGI